MKALILAAAVAAVSTSSEAAPASYLLAVESEPFEATGNVEDLTRKGGKCIAQILKPGFTDAPTILREDVAQGTVVANNAFAYTETIWGMQSVFTGRSIVTFEAKPGRFRLIHRDIQVMNLGAWSPIRSAKDGKRDEMREQLTAISVQIADCVKAAPVEW